jgi:hypothetical protein
MTLQLYRSGGSLFRRAGGLAVERLCCECSPPPNCYCPPTDCYLWVSFPAQLGIPSTDFLKPPSCSFFSFQEATGTPAIGGSQEIFPELILNGSKDARTCLPATYTDGPALRGEDFSGYTSAANFSRAQFIRGSGTRFNVFTYFGGIAEDCAAWSSLAGSLSGLPTSSYPPPCSVQDEDYLYSWIQGCGLTRRVRQTVLPIVFVESDWNVLTGCNWAQGANTATRLYRLEVSFLSTVTVLMARFRQNPQAGIGGFAVNGDLEERRYQPIRSLFNIPDPTHYYRISKRVRIEFPVECEFKPGFVCNFSAILEFLRRRPTYSFTPTGTIEIAESGVSFRDVFYPWDEVTKTENPGGPEFVPAEFTLPEISGLIPPPPVTLTLNHRKCEEGDCDCNADISGLSVGFEGKSFTIGTPGLFTERNESWRYQLASGGSEHVFTYKKLACGSYALEEKTVVLYCEAGEEDRWLADVQSICRITQCDCDASLDGLKILFEGQEFDYGEGQVFGNQEPGGSVWFESGPGQYTRINYSSEAGCTAPDVPVASQLSANIAFCSDGRWEVDFVHICNDLAGGCNPVATDTSIYRWIGILCCDSEGRLIGTPHAIDDPNEPPGLDDFYDPNPENFDDPQCDASTLPEFEVLGPSEEEEEEYGFCENRWVYEFQCDDEGRPFLTVGFSNLQQVDEYPQCSEDASCEVPQPPLFTIQA